MDVARGTPAPLPAGTTYEVRLEGCIEAHWSEWLAGLELRHEERAGGRSETVILLPGADAARLHGLLAHVGALNLTLISVNSREPAGET